MAGGIHLFEPGEATATVACGSCVECCKRTAVILMPDDAALLWAQAEWHPVAHPFADLPRTPVLKHKPNGDCVFLGPEGCTVYGDRPKMCRVFSCVEYVKRIGENMPRPARRRAIKTGDIDKAVWKAGQERLA